MSVKVSVILAIYNVEKYIRQTLDSVVNQTFKDIEIIVVDNKSTDKTLDIVKEYAEKDKRFVIYKNTENLKQGIARNFGVQMARGDYIFFIDGDDYMELNAIERAYESAGINRHYSPFAEKQKFPSNVFFPSINYIVNRPNKNSQVCYRYL